MDDRRILSPVPTWVFLELNGEHLERTLPTTAIYCPHTAIVSMVRVCGERDGEREESWVRRGKEKSVLMGRGSIKKVRGDVNKRERSERKGATPETLSLSCPAPQDPIHNYAKQYWVSKE